jgi:hypothetical protein
LKRDSARLCNHNWSLCVFVLSARFRTGVRTGFFDESSPPNPIILPIVAVIPIWGLGIRSAYRRTVTTK